MDNFTEEFNLVVVRQVVKYGFWQRMLLSTQGFQLKVCTNGGRRLNSPVKGKIRLNCWMLSVNNIKLGSESQWRHSNHGGPCRKLRSSHQNAAGLIWCWPSDWLAHQDLACTSRKSSPLSLPYLNSKVCDNSNHNQMRPEVQIGQRASPNNVAN